MEHRKHGRRLLGLLAVAALGVMAFAANAQAVNHPQFEIDLAAALLATVGAKQLGRGTMLVPGLNLELNCEKFTVDTGHLAGPTDATIVLLYTECTTLSITKLPEEVHCHVKEPIKAEALLLPAELNSGAPAILLEKLKAIVRLHLPAAGLESTPCVLPLQSTVTGEVCLKINNPPHEVEVEVEASDSIQGECKVKSALEGLEGSGSTKDVLKYGAQTVTLDGKADVFLTGIHEGKQLGVDLP